MAAPFSNTSNNPAVLSGGQFGAVIASTDYTDVPEAIVAGDLSITGDLVVTGSISGSSSVASVSTIANDATTNATMYPVWVTANTGNLPLKVSSTKLSFNPSTGALTSTSFVGNVTGNVSGTAATVTTAAQTAITSLGTLTGLTISGALASSSSIKTSSPTAGLGFATGAGGVVTQETDKSTTVVLNTSCGTITMNNAALNGLTSVSFTLTNSVITANDVVKVCIKSGATANSYTVGIGATGTGSCVIQLNNITAATTLSEAVVLNFVVIKGVAA